MQTVKAFSLPGQWYKGSLHIHSTASDGRLTPDEVMGWYRERGYHFLALTDHRVQSVSRQLSDDFIALSGIEVDGVDPQSGLYHLLGLGGECPPGVTNRDTVPVQGAINRLRDAGALVILAHPYWSGQMSKDLLGLEGLSGLEVYNGGCEVDDAKGFSVVHWDDLLAAGRSMWGFAVDDAHWRTGDRDAGLGWVWVKATELTERAIVRALEQGTFYSSTGPEIYSLELEGDWIRVHCSPVVSIDFVGSGRLSRRISAPPGQTLTGTSYRPRKGQGYVRVACRDVQGCQAWSNPIFLDGRGQR